MEYNSDAINEIKIFPCPHVTGNMKNFLLHSVKIHNCHDVSYENKKYLSQNASQLLEEFREIGHWKNNWEGQYYPINGTTCDVSSQFSTVEARYNADPKVLERVYAGFRINPQRKRAEDVVPSCMKCSGLA